MNEPEELVAAGRRIGVPGLVAPGTVNQFVVPGAGRFVKVCNEKAALVQVTMAFAPLRVMLIVCGGRLLLTTCERLFVMPR